MPQRNWPTLVLAAGILSLASPCAWAQGTDLVLQGARVIVNPQVEPLDNQTVILQDETIVAVGKTGEVLIPEGSTILDCKGMTIVAGFWNSHVHFTEPFWEQPDKAPVDRLDRHMEQMLTRWGFVDVWDLGSDIAQTQMVRVRITNGELAGPKIFMAEAMYPKNGHPVYISSGTRLPEVANPKQSAALAKSFMTTGTADGLKLFTGAFMGPGAPVIVMDEYTAKAAVDVAHARGKPVFAHPQNWAGTDSALAAGVDILAHTIPSEKNWKPEELARMKAQKTALIPTLALWHTVMLDSGASADATERMIQYGVDELKAFAAQGGTVLFGTDVGFTQEYDTTRELQYMGRALGWRDILASLTTNPCDFFKQEHCGRVVVGNDASLVVLQADPSVDVRNMAKVEYTIRDGRVIYSAHPDSVAKRVVPAVEAPAEAAPVTAPASPVPEKTDVPSAAAPVAAPAEPVTPATPRKPAPLSEPDAAPVAAPETPATAPATPPAPAPAPETPAIPIATPAPPAAAAIPAQTPETPSSPAPAP